MINKRKHIRIKDYDYSSEGCYFITFCVKNRENILGYVGRDALIPPDMQLSAIGVTAKKYIENINRIYNGNVILHKYVIMPNHIHLLIELCGGGMKASRPTVNTIVRSLKTMVTKEIGYSVWQASFYEHIVRNEEDYRNIWNYIENNPVLWDKDEMYCEDVKSWKNLNF